MSYHELLSFAMEASYVREGAAVADAAPAPVLVLGIGNLNDADGGAGLFLWDAVKHRGACAEDVEYLDGGPGGFELLRTLRGRQRLILLGALAAGSEPGTVHLLRNDDVEELLERRAAEACGIFELLSFARQDGSLPEEVTVVGIEPLTLESGIGMSEPVSAAMEQASMLALTEIRSAAKLYECRRKLGMVK